jgi:predicted O-methyltransferase YrrM
MFDKAAKFLRGASLIIRNPWLMNRVLDDEEVNRRIVVKEHGFGNGLPVVDILDLIPGFEETVEPFGFLDGGSLPIDIALLKGLARQRPNAHYLEIGTWRGESVANVAAVAEHCVTINLPDSEMQRIGLDKEYIELHRHFSQRLPNVTHLQHDSRTLDFNTLNEKFDVIFIDGDHHYESVRSDTANSFKALRNERSVIVWHDYGHDPASVRWDVLRGILDGTPADKRKNLYRVSNTLCAIYIPYPIKSAPQARHQVPAKHFRIDIKAVKR